VSDFAEATADEQVRRLTGLARRALAAWGLDESPLSLLKYRENAVFSVGDEGGARCVLRIHRPGYRSDAEIRSEAAWMRALADVGVRTPEMLPTQAGDLVELARGDGVPEPRQCDLFRWVDGAQLGSIEAGVGGGADAVASAYHTLGGLAALMHEHAVHWKRPEGFTRPDWGLDALLGESPSLGRFWELPGLAAEQRRLLFRARDRARETLSEFGATPDRYGLIHGDFLPENVLVSEAGPRLIDFDDSGQSWYGFELATALFPLLLQGYLADARAAYLDGYRARRALPEEHLAVLPAQLMARGLSYLGWPAGRPEMEEGRLLRPLLIASVTQLAERYLGGEPLGLAG
jgi:Ser/Thr protein kinase RdoA (MazF antagonist)